MKKFKYEMRDGLQMRESDDDRVARSSLDHIEWKEADGGPRR